MRCCKPIDRIELLRVRCQQYRSFGFLLGDDLLQVLGHVLGDGGVGVVVRDPAENLQVKGSDEHDLAVLYLVQLEEDARSTPFGAAEPVAELLGARGELLLGQLEIAEFVLLRFGFVAVLGVFGAGLSSVR
jgi:hypothetical protein